jgi:uncharacterized Zn-binding protein involved in type VI secretion
MGQPAIVMGDRITGQCAIHQVPNPASGVPQPSPAPMPFSAPLQSGLKTTVLIGGKAAAVVGSWGLNFPPHIGLHVTDPYTIPSMQRGSVVGGSATVLIGGQMAATASSSAICCAGLAGSLVPTVANVMIG